MWEDDTSTLRVLAALPQQTDRAALARIFSHSSWNIDFCETLQGAQAQLDGRKIGVIISDSVLPDGDWKDLLRTLPVEETKPKVIVALPTADSCVWAEVLNLGGYDVLMTPFHHEEVVRLVSLAWLVWRDSKKQQQRPRKGQAVDRRQVAVAVA